MVPDLQRRRYPSDGTEGCGYRYEFEHEIFEASFCDVDLPHLSVGLLLSIDLIPRWSEGGADVL